MFERRAYKRLVEWKYRSAGSSALLIEGARRVGKTSLAKQFARQEYGSHLVVDFADAPPEVVTLFERQTHDIDRLLSRLQAIYGVRLKQRNALIIFDEVQMLPRARQSIKYLVADGRFDYLETGSLISIKKNVKDIVIPSEEEHLELTPMNFGEFLNAIGEDLLAEEIEDAFHRREALDNILHPLAERLFREYLLVGGMPQAVKAYAADKDFVDADRQKRQILSLYRDDVAKAGEDASRVGAIFDEIPGQLSKGEKRFTLAAFGTNARYRDYAGAVFWLADSRISNVARNSTDPGAGLKLHEEANSFKCYMGDTGLLVTHAFAGNKDRLAEVYRHILFGTLGVNEGMLTENYVAQQLRASGDQLFYYSRRDDKNWANTMEIDFLLLREYDRDGIKPKISPVEVKSKKRYSVRSLEKFREKFGARVGTEYVLHPRQLKIEGERVYLPLYMAHLL